MSARLRRYLLLAGLLGALCVALAGTLYRQLTTHLVPTAGVDDEGSRVIEAADAIDPTLALQAAGLADSGTFDEITERPLFAPSRRPPQDAASAEAEAEATPAPSFVLRGVVHSGPVRRALLQTDESMPLLRLREGEMLDGWEVTTIMPRKMIIRQGEQSLEVLLFPPQSPEP